MIFQWKTGIAYRVEEGSHNKKGNAHSSLESKSDLLPFTLILAYVLLSHLFVDLLNICTKHPSITSQLAHIILQANSLVCV